MWVLLILYKNLLNRSCHLATDHWGIEKDLIKLIQLLSKGFTVLSQNRFMAIAVLHHQLILFSSPSWTVTHCLSQTGLNSSYFNLTSAEITGMNYDAQLMVNNVHCLLFKINGKKREETNSIISGLCLKQLIETINHEINVKPNQTNKQNPKHSPHFLWQRQWAMGHARFSDPDLVLWLG